MFRSTAFALDSQMLARLRAVLAAARGMYANAGYVVLPHPLFAAGYLGLLALDLVLVGAAHCKRSSVARCALRPAGYPAESPARRRRRCGGAAGT
jgi:hypothetical protein